MKGSNQQHGEICIKSYKSQPTKSIAMWVQIWVWLEPIMNQH